MKLNLEIKNPDRALKPSKNYVILHNGREWYITTKEDLFKEFEERLNKKEKEISAKLKECDKQLAEINKIKASVAKQILDIGEIVEQFVSKEGKIK